MLNFVLLIIWEGAVISIAGWIRSRLLRRRAGPDCLDSPVETTVEKYPEGVDLNQEWDEMDELTPWAQNEIDRLQERLKVSGHDNNKL